MRPAYPPGHSREDCGSEERCRRLREMENFEEGPVDRNMFGAEGEYVAHVAVGHARRQIGSPDLGCRPAEVLARRQGPGCRVQLRQPALEGDGNLGGRNATAAGRAEVTVEQERGVATRGHPLAVDRVEGTDGIAESDEPGGPAW